MDGSDYSMGWVCVIQVGLNNRGRQFALNAFSMKLARVFSGSVGTTTIPLDNSAIHLFPDNASCSKWPELEDCLV